MLVNAPTVYPSRYPTLEETMNAFYQHHKDTVAFPLSLLRSPRLNATIQPFQQPERVMRFFGSYRQLYPVSRKVLRDMASHYHHGVQHASRNWGALILEALEEERRDQFLPPISAAPSPTGSWPFSKPARPRAHPA